MAVRVVTDSATDFPPELAAELGVVVVPATVFFGEQAFRDGVDLSHEEFFRRLTTGNVMPKTAQPNVAEFLEAYKPIVEAGDSIVSVHVSSKLSGTLNSAQNAAQELPGARIETVDSLNASFGAALIVKAAADAAKAGGDVDAVAQAARGAVGSTRLFIVLDTLEYLQKGGRIGKAASLAGSLLALKPILTIADGEIHPHEKVRTRAKAVERMLAIAEADAPYDEVALVHVTTPETVEAVLARLAPLSGKPVVVGRVGPAVGTYSGPGAVGIVLRK